MVAGMLALFALACGPPARAEVLVSNIGQNGDAWSPLINAIGGNLSPLNHAQGFTTGNNDAGYTLTSIDIYFHNTTDGTTPTVTLHEGSPTGTLVDTPDGTGERFELRDVRRIQQHHPGPHDLVFCGDGRKFFQWREPEHQRFG